ncbi:DNA alkylation repair protein [Dyadobacter sp. CY356]|uniref:DNA alkylation repair protein n=1 Tax=Dyadobacter sp. CY356 TaxID=2906442 RepID=UPI001F1E05CC|nr:DNA alkylation repair protein [Dyadobacter sp. CY356]MCF0055112.1 DNA alkylation repair protein [Dyadobacter sp. CY356]
MQIQQILDDIKKIEHGFKHIIEAGNKILSAPDKRHFDVAKGLLADKNYQVRMLGTYILGQLAPNNQDALSILETQIPLDNNWRVQEMLAKALDHYCQMLGYEQCLQAIKRWLSDENANFKRAVVEGFRIWTSRPYFSENPAVAIALISKHKADPSEYLRKSVGNALRDIGKKHPDMIRNEIATWDLSESKTKFTYKYVIKF